MLDTVAVPDPPDPETIEATVSTDGGSFADDFPVPLAPAALLTSSPDGGWWLSDPGIIRRLPTSIRARTVCWYVAR